MIYDLTFYCLLPRQYIILMMLSFYHLPRQNMIYDVSYCSVLPRWYIILDMPYCYQLPRQYMIPDIPYSSILTRQNKASDIVTNYRDSK